MSKQPTLGERVKSYRLDRLWKQKQMAAFLEVSIGTIVRLERGENCYDVTRAKVEKLLSGKSQVAA